jgi:hypothetical protein
VLLPSGKVLCVAGPTEGQGPTSESNPATFFEYDSATNTLTPTSQPEASVPTNDVMMLLLPTGQVLVTAAGSLVVYAPQNSAALPAWAPVITDCPSVISPGDQFTLSGQQLNGLSQAVSYGDDYTAATNYPLVQLRLGNLLTYCKTTQFSTQGVATGQQIVTVQVDVPQSAPVGTGSPQLVVIANGIPSVPVSVTYKVAHAGGVQTVSIPGTFTRTIGGENDGWSITLTYQNGHLVGVNVNPPVGPHPVWDTGDVTVSATAVLLQLASATNNQELSGHLEAVAKRIAEKFTTTARRFLETL